MTQPRIHIKWYALGDLVAAAATWPCFYYIRTLIYRCPFTVPHGFYTGWMLYTAGWMFLHFLSGAYEPLYRKSRLTELFRSMAGCLTGCILLLFFFILKNPQENNDDYYLEFIGLLVPITICTTFFRLSLLSIAKRQLRRQEVYFNVLMIGSAPASQQFYHTFNKVKEASGYRITGFLNTSGTEAIAFAPAIHVFHHMENLSSIIQREQIEDVVITIDKSERALLTTALQYLSSEPVSIHLTPDTVDIISGALKTSNVIGVPLIGVENGYVSTWQRNMKRLIDIIASITGMILLSPLFLYVAIRTMLSSNGPVFYIQERVGYKRKPFYIYKFRSMIKDAERQGPLLSNTHDPRVTPWGRVMRKWRLDELPQLWNILKGEMSLVGPRPERAYYIEQIVARHPEYNFIFKVKPGLTSWGMVKFGYASSVEEMLQRMPYDLLYVENASLMLDLKIMIHTLLIIVAGKGK